MPETRINLIGFASVVLLVLGSFSTRTLGTSPAEKPSDRSSMPPSYEANATALRSSLPDEFQSIARWAIDLFDNAGLVLPPLRFVYHGDDDTRCKGRTGMHRIVDTTSIIEICTTTTGFPDQVMVLHELAHAWTHHRLPHERKAAFRRLRGWEHWRNYDAAPWHENGTEQAAEILVWGLLDRPINIVRIDQNSCDELLDGYRTLTTLEPPYGYRDHCEPHISDDPDVPIDSMEGRPGRRRCEAAPSGAGHRPCHAK